MAVPRSVSAVPIILYAWKLEQIEEESEIELLLSLNIHSHIANAVVGIV